MELKDMNPALSNAMFEYILAHNKKDIFKKALETGDRDTFNLLPKSDLHIHSTRGSSREAFEIIFHTKFPEVPRFNSLKEMDEWYDKVIDPYAKDYFGYMVRMHSLYTGFEKNTVTVAAPIHCLRMSKYFHNDIEEYLRYLRTLFTLLTPHTQILPEFEVYRGEDPDDVIRQLESVEKYDYFKSIDLRGDEKLGTKEYKEVFEKAKQMGLVLKAHAGEFTGPSYIDEALEYLDLDCITHAISLTQSEELMKYVRDKEIMINCCPSSNYYLSRVDSYSNHPIKEFVRNGIICSINTDDEIIFNQSINDEYFNIFNSNCLTSDELFEVNQNGLEKCLNRRKR